MQTSRFTKLHRRLRSAYPQPVCALEHRNSFELLAATILSAQCTDKMVNRVTPALFARYPDAPALAHASLADVEALVRTTGFFRNKARALVGMAQALVANHAGKVPADMEALVRLPGVARKTANVVLGVGFGRAVGVVVDTHVSRLAQRLGLSRATTPVQIEQDLMSLVPRRCWIDFSHRLIEHGRAVCVARRPKCVQCSLSTLCPSAQTPA